MPRRKKENLNKPTLQPPFGRVSAARQILKNMAEELIQDYVDTIKEARAAQEFDAAIKAQQWLIEHLPADDDGDKVIDVSIDKQQKPTSSQSSGPNIQIGFALGGLPEGGKPKKALPVVIEADIVEK